MFFGIRAQKQFQLSSDNIYKTLIMLIEINTSEENHHAWIWSKCPDSVTFLFLFFHSGLFQIYFLGQNDVQKNTFAHFS